MSKKIFPEDFFGLPNNTKDIFTTLKIISERKNSRVIEHPKLLNPLSPNNNKLGIGSIKEENLEDSSITFREIPEKINQENNQFQNNNSNEDGEHSTSGSSKTQISSSKSNNSTIEVCKVFNKNDNTPIENDDMLKITPHFINEKSINRNINLVFNSHNNKNNNKNKEKKAKYSRPLTPNLNIIRKSSAPICENNANKFISKIKNDNGYLIEECKKYIKNIDNNIYKEKESNRTIDTNINNNSGLNQDDMNTETNIKKHSFSCAKQQILKKCNNNKYIDDFINEKNDIQKKNINNFDKKKSNKSSTNTSSNNFNSKIPFSFNTNKSIQPKKKIKNNPIYLKREKSQKKEYSIVSRRNSGDKNLTKKNPIRNVSRQNKNEVIFSNRLKSFRSDNKITVVHSKVNNEINNLFSGLSDNIAKDPEIQNKIESLIKDIKDIQQVVHIKSQSHFRPRKHNSFNCRKKE